MRYIVNIAPVIHNYIVIYTMLWLLSEISASVLCNQVNIQSCVYTTNIVLLTINKSLDIRFTV